MTAPYMGISTAGIPAEEVVMRSAVYEILPSLETLYINMERLNLIWNVNHIPEKLAAATAAGTPLGNWDTKDMTRLGQALMGLKLAMAEEFTIHFLDGTSEVSTLEKVLLTRYLPVSST